MHLISTIFMSLTALLLLVYAFLIGFYHRIWRKIPDQSTHALPEYNSGSEVRVGHPALPIKVSVVIPARNEEEHIGHCLDALSRQTYPAEQTEIIVVNDFSHDTTADRVRAYRQCILLNLSDYVSGEINSYKKKAIETGIRHARGELILCTDADCTMDKDWIRTMVSAFEEKQAAFLSAPVKIVPDGSWISVFQSLDFISLQGITGAAVFQNLYPMCNGANLGYTRAAFEQVGGFSGVDHIASGDDMLLMKKISASFPGRVRYIKDTRAIVETGAAKNLRTFLRQRIRWASKISHYDHKATFYTLALVYLLNLFLLVFFVACFFTGQWWWLLAFLLFKTISEYSFVARVAGFFNLKKLMPWFPLCQPVHILYTVVAGSFGSFGSYEWKNRKVK